MTVKFVAPVLNETQLKFPKLLERQKLPKQPNIVNARPVFWLPHYKAFGKTSKENQAISEMAYYWKWQKILLDDKSVPFMS